MKNPSVRPSRAALLCSVVAMVGLGGCESEDRYEKMVVVGDSLTAGVQTGTVFYVTQPNGYAVQLAYKVLEDPDTQFPLPLLGLPLPAAQDPIGGRRRVDPTVESPNLGVSGADVHDVIETEATATSAAAIRTEFDRVLFPRTGTQIDAAIDADPDLMILWIGNNDALGSVTNCSLSPPDCTINGVFGLTPADQFRADYDEAVHRLLETDADLVVANIPAVSAIAYLIPAANLGVPLPAGSRVPLPIARAIIADPTLAPVLLGDPDNWLDPIEAARINAHIDLLNDAIADVAAEHDAAVVDIHGFFNNIIQRQPITIEGTTFRLSADYAPALSATGTSGGFSLDGVHPSNTAYALIANEFIRVINASYDKDFDLVDVASIAALNPYLDNDGDFCIEGPGFFSVPGVTGDNNDANPQAFQCRPAGKPGLPGLFGQPSTIPFASPLGPDGWNEWIRLAR